MDFGKKDLNDVFALDGKQSVSVRDILILKQVLKSKEYEKLKKVIVKLISDQSVTNQDIMNITQKLRTTAWKYMQKLAKLDVVMADGKTNNIVYR